LLGATLIVFGLMAITGLDHAFEAVLTQLSPGWLTRLTSSI
jgi:hypothetical protein